MKICNKEVNHGIIEYNYEGKLKECDFYICVKNAIEVPYRSTISCNIPDLQKERIFFYGKGNTPEECLTNNSDKFRQLGKLLIELADNIDSK